LDRHTLISAGIVEGDDILHIAPAVDPGDGEDPLAIRGIPLNLYAAAQRRIIGADLREFGQGAVHHRVLVIAVFRAGSAADDAVRGELLDLGGEHVLARVLVAAPADEALLVAVVDDGLAAGEVHQRVGELTAAQQRSSSWARRRGRSRHGPCRGCRGRSAVE
jgi:hypothetical protein